MITTSLSLKGGGYMITWYDIFTFVIMLVAVISFTGKK